MEIKMTFEEAVARLEVIVHTMESGNVSLEESLALFQEGVSLVQYCNQKLDTAEQKIKLLAEDKNGQMIETDMN